MLHIFQTQFRDLTVPEADHKVRDLLAAIAVCADLSSEQKLAQRTALKRWFRSTYGDRLFFSDSPLHKRCNRSRRVQAKVRSVA